jgi:hypothetical protein
MDYELIYTSIATRHYGPEELAEMLARFRARNETVGVTGMLVYHRERFLQVLEGARADVQATFDRILGDPRHDEIKVIHEGPLIARAFAHWSMAFENLGTTDLSENEGWSDFFEQGFTFEVIERRPSTGRRLLEELRLALDR